MIGSGQCRCGCRRWHDDKFYCDSCDVFNEVEYLKVREERPINRVEVEFLESRIGALEIRIGDIEDKLERFMNLLGNKFKYFDKEHFMTTSE